MPDTSILMLQLLSIEKAQQRTRKAFFLSLLASCIVMIFAFNLTFSQDRRMPNPADYSDESGTPTEEYKLRVKSHVDRWYYSVPLLGITVSLEDFSLVGPLALFVFSFYYVSCLRNVVLQLDDLESPELTPTDRLMAKVTILGELVLNTTGAELTSKSNIGKLVARGSMQNINVYRILLVVPFIASVSALVCDVAYSYFRFAFSKGNIDHLNYFSSRPDLLSKVSIVCFDIIGLLVCWVVLSYCLAAVAYSKESSDLSAKIIYERLPNRMRVDDEVAVLN